MSDTTHATAPAQGGKVRASFRAGATAGATAVAEPAPAPVDPAPAPEHPAGEGTGRSVPTWLLLGLAVLLVLLLGATAALRFLGGNDAEAARAAQVAAEEAVVPVLSYDHADLEASQREAQAHLTGKYREEYDKLFAVIEENAPETQTTVDVEVLSSGIVRATRDRVHVLVFVDRPTTNKLSTEPVVYKDQVTLSMQLVDGEWLVDDMVTSPAS
ncbi:MAG: hypothetical protein LT071_06675 [Nocardioides sp.]|nr:hypothetical protein [Nocardioides sp.]